MATGFKGILDPDVRTEFETNEKTGSGFDQNTGIQIRNSGQKSKEDGGAGRRVRSAGQPLLLGQEAQHALHRQPRRSRSAFLSLHLSVAQPSQFCSLAPALL